MSRCERALRALTAGNRTLLRATDEQQLLQDMCRVIVETAGYATAWVGYAEHDPQKSIRVMAFHGFDGEPSQSPYYTWGDNEEGRTTAGSAIRTGQAAIGRHILTDPQVLPRWREEARRRGYASVSSFPLFIDGQVIGNLTVFAAEPDAFDTDEVELLSELASDLTYGIKALRANLERARAVALHRRTDRGLRTLSAGNHTVLRATEEQQLLQDMCRVIVDVGGYRTAWIGYAENDAEKTIRPVAYAGFEGEPEQAPRFTWAETGQGNTATAMAIRSGQPCIGRRLLSDPNVEPAWREEAQRRGYASVSAYPLFVEGIILGSLTIYATEADAFDEAEGKLLGEMADDLAFGIATLRLRVRHQKDEETIERMAYFDPLTGLPNRARLDDLLAETIAAARLQNRPLALLVLDVDRFRQINEVIGYARGDTLLRGIGLRLQGLLSQAEILAHLGRDEFAILLPRSDANRATETAQRILNALEAPFDLTDIRVEVRASIGISLFPGHGTDPELLLLRADSAVTQAKRTHTGYALFRGDTEPENRRRLSLVGDLRRAIEGNELLLYYQPKIDMRSGLLCGAEALVRWQHPDLGLVSPDKFIPLAEHTGLIQPLTHWVVNTALGQCYAWHEMGLHTPLAVNLSMPNLRDPRLPGRIAGILTTWGAKPDWLQIEVTETSLMEDPAGTMEVLRRLSGMGMKIFVDDFGTGYSSLSYLQKLPIDAIKIDKSFVLGVPDDEDSLVIVRSTIDLAHDLDLRVVAEGVESGEIWEQLAALGCDEAQGTYVSEPIPAGQFLDWQKQWQWPKR